MENKYKWIDFDNIILDKYKGEVLTKSQIRSLFLELYEETKHGDEEHQQWLKDKINDFIDKKLK
jgi:hypothetical protein